jgi:hypothetical protein
VVLWRPPGERLVGWSIAKIHDAIDHITVQTQILWARCKPLFISSERPHLPLVARVAFTRLPPGSSKYPDSVLDLSSLDLDEIATALADQTDYEHRWLINPETGEIAFWTADTGIDGHTPVDLDELSLVCIDPLPSYVWYQDMADFADQITDARARGSLARAIEGTGAFRRFKDELHQRYAHLVPAWHTFRDVRARNRAVEWLVDNSLIDYDTARGFVYSHPDPDLP